MNDKLGFVSSRVLDTRGVYKDRGGEYKCWRNFK